MAERNAAAVSRGRQGEGDVKRTATARHAASNSIKRSELSNLVAVGAPSGTGNTEGRGGEHH